MQQAARQELLDSIEFALDMKFGSEALFLMVEIVKIQDIDLLRIVRKGIKSAETAADVRSIYS
jgi:hypothetical protein